MMIRLILLLLTAAAGNQVTQVDPAADPRPEMHAWALLALAKQETPTPTDAGSELALANQRGTHVQEGDIK